MRDREGALVPDGRRDASDNGLNLRPMCVQPTDGELLDRLADLLNRLDSPPEVRLAHRLSDEGGSR